MAQRRWYPTDLTDRAWALIAPLLPTAKPGGRPRSTDLREGLNALRSWLRTGGAWHLLPHDFPPWKTVSHCWRTWRLSGDWERIHAVLRERSRQRAGREPTPSAGIIDSQTIKTTQRGGPPDSHGDDGGKQVSGRKRHLLVDTGGLVLKALVPAADSTDRQGGQQLLEALDDLTTAFPRLCYLWVDAAYPGSFKDWVEQTVHWTVAVVQRRSRGVWVPADQEPPERPAGFQLLARRGVGERPFGWLGRWRRTSTDDDYLPATSQCVIELTMIRIMLRRLAEC